MQLANPPFTKPPLCELPRERILESKETPVIINPTVIIIIIIVMIIVMIIAVVIIVITIIDPVAAWRASSLEPGLACGNNNNDNNSIVVAVVVVVVEVEEVVVVVAVAVVVVVAAVVVVEVVVVITVGFAPRVRERQESLQNIADFYLGYYCKNNRDYIAKTNRYYCKNNRDYCNNNILLFRNILQNNRILLETHRNTQIISSCQVFKGRRRLRI